MYQTLKDLNLQPGDVVEHQYKAGYPYTVNSSGLLCHGETLTPLYSDHQKGGYYHKKSVSWKLISRAPRLLPWGQLPDKEKVELLLAHQRGEVIEVASPSGTNWLTVVRPEWEDSCYYRVRPEPVVKQVALCYREDNGQVKNKIGTVNLVDGVVDPSSAKFDGVTT